MNTEPKPNGMWRCPKCGNIVCRGTNWQTLVMAGQVDMHHTERCNNDGEIMMAVNKGGETKPEPEFQI